MVFIFSTAIHFGQEMAKFYYKAVTAIKSEKVDNPPVKASLSLFMAGGASAKAAW